MSVSPSDGRTGKAVRRVAATLTPVRPPVDECRVGIFYPINFQLFLGGTTHELLSSCHRQSILIAGTLAEHRKLETSSPCSPLIGRGGIVKFRILTRSLDKFGSIRQFTPPLIG